ncbi:MAG: hypothetical protein ACR2OO_13585 [Thermomicrobiales bacterium]
MIAVGEALLPAIEIVAANYVDTSAPIVIEGDAILPSLLTLPLLRPRAAGGLIRAVFLTESDESVLLANMKARGRGVVGTVEADLRTEARAKWLHGRWLAADAARAGLPVLESRPWATLAERIIAATG